MAACSCKAIGETCHYTCLCIKFWNYNHLGYLKGANEVKRQYFQQAVLFGLLKALYYAQNYAGIIRQGLYTSLAWHIVYIVMSA